MKKTLMSCLFAAILAAAPSGAQTTTSYTLELADGVSPDCAIVASPRSRALLTACTEVKRGKVTQTECNYGSFPISVDGKTLPAVLLVPLTSFTHSGNTYTYSWQNPTYNMVAIQVDLTNYKVPDIWNGSCTYTPTYGGSNTTFYQQYTNPASDYTCGCNEGWVTP